jgi:hypothetical protein
MVFTFSSSVNTTTFQLPLVDDDILEADENLTASLSFTGGMVPPRVSIVVATAELTIVNDDCKYNIVNESACINGNDVSRKMLTPLCMLYALHNSLVFYFVQLPVQWECIW